MPIKRVCQREGCENEFETLPSQVKVGKGKYCSRVCRGMAERKRIKRACQREGCENEFTTFPSRIKRGAGKYCSPKCSNLAKWSSGVYSKGNCKKAHAASRRKAHERAGDMYSRAVNTTLDFDLSGLSQAEYGRKNGIEYSSLREGVTVARYTDEQTKQDIRDKKISFNEVVRRAQKNRKEKNKMARATARTPETLTPIGKRMKEESGEPTNEIPLEELAQKIKEKKKKISGLTDEKKAWLDEKLDIRNRIKELREDSESLADLPVLQRIKRKLENARRKRTLEQSMVDTEAPQMSINEDLVQQLTFLVGLQDDYLKEKLIEVRRKLSDANADLMDKLDD